MSEIVKGERGAGLVPIDCAYWHEGRKIALLPGY